MAWLARAEPDIVCLQELKAEQRAFPGYPSIPGIWRGLAGRTFLERRSDPRARPRSGADSRRASLAILRITRRVTLRRP